jgi:uncharacterized glyoxalase superfamily protein PhnB
MSMNRVSLITLGVSDLSRSVSFYESLGWTVGERNEGVAFFQMNGMMLGLFSAIELAKDLGRPGTTLGTGTITLAQNYASQADVDTAFASALAAGATPLKAPEPVFWGGYSGYFTDPDGHVWELAHNPFWRQNPDGTLDFSDSAGTAP